MRVILAESAGFCYGVHRAVDLARKAAFSFWEQLDEERTVIRFVTSWATRMEDVEELIRRL